MKRVLTQIHSSVKEQDLFGVPVQLTYKGERTFNTAIGGCCSLLMIIFLVSYFGF